MGDYEYTEHLRTNCVTVDELRKLSYKELEKEISKFEKDTQDKINVDINTLKCVCLEKYIEETEIGKRNFESVFYRNKTEKVDQLISNADKILADILEELKELKTKCDRLEERRYELAGKRMKLIQFKECLDTVDKTNLEKDFEEFE